MQQNDEGATVDTSKPHRIVEKDGSRTVFLGIINIAVNPDRDDRQENTGVTHV